MGGEEEEIRATILKPCLEFVGLLVERDTRQALAHLLIIQQIGEDILFVLLNAVLVPLFELRSEPCRIFVVGILGANFLREGHDVRECLFVALDARLVIVEQVLDVDLQNLVDLEVLEKGEADGEEDALVPLVGLGHRGTRGATAERRDVVCPRILVALISTRRRQLEVVADLGLQLREVYLFVVQGLHKEWCVQRIQRVRLTLLLHGVVRDQMENAGEALRRRVLLVGEEAEHALEVADVVQHLA